MVDLDADRAAWRKERINQVAEKIGELGRDQENATTWGAAVGARGEWLNDLRRELKCLTLGMDPSPSNAGLPPKRPYPQPGGPRPKFTTPEVLTMLGNLEGERAYSARIDSLIDATFSVGVQFNQNWNYDVILTKHDRLGSPVGSVEIWTNLEHGEAALRAQNLASFTELPVYEDENSL